VATHLLDQIYQRVRALAQAFLSWGAQKGDRIALIAENRWEWAITDFAALAIGAVDVPIYPTLTGEQIARWWRTRAAASPWFPPAAIRQAERRPQSDPVETDTDHGLPAPEGATAFRDVLAGADERGTERDPVFDALAHSVEPRI